MNAVRHCVGLLLLALAPDEAALKETLFPFYAREAAAYEFFTGSDRDQKLELRKQPVLTWTNAERYMGAVFIWELGGRPEMIGCIGSHQNRPDASVVFHEFHSLSTQPLADVKFGSGEIWKPSKPGVQLAPLADAPSPSDSERLRLTQMRNLAREFRGWMQDNEDVEELRLLTQPLVRYKAEERGVIDGAIFTMVWKGTDPEVLLILEDRKSDGGDAWHYALARFNFRDLWVTHQDKEIWRVEVSRQNEFYITGITGDVRLEDIRAAR